MCSGRHVFYAGLIIVDDDFRFNVLLVCFEVIKIFIYCFPRDCYPSPFNIFTISNSFWCKQNKFIHSTTGILLLHFSTLIPFLSRVSGIATLQPILSNALLSSPSDKTVCPPCFFGFCRACRCSVDLGVLYNSSAYRRVIWLLLNSFKAVSSCSLL